MSFDSEYKRLNPTQKAAVDTIDGPVMVIAGPGTGKTQVLALRIANILLKTDSRPYNVLALTFTDAASKNMRQRLVSFIGPAAYQVEVKTFHSFCEEVIRSHPEYFPIDRDSEPMDDIERFEVLRTLLKNPNLVALRTPGSQYHYLKDIQKDIADLKKEGISPEKFDALVADESTWFEKEKETLKKVEIAKWESLIAKHHELSLLYHQYQEYLLTHHRYDFEDMIIETVRAFQAHDVLLLEYQERFHYILVDEYQDTNSAQNTVVDLLSSYWGEDANLFTVGDPHQTIYRFQGASMENMVSFLERYKKTTLITLDIGYRCTQPIYDSASALISHNPLPQVQGTPLELNLLTTLRSVSSTSNLLHLSISPSPLLELHTLAASIQRLTDAGVKASGIAVVCKKNSQCDDVSFALGAHGIPYVVERGNDVLASQAVQQLLTLLRVINGLPSHTEQDCMFELLNFEWVHLDPLLVMKLTRATGKSKTHTHIYDLVREGHSSIKKLRGCEDITKEELKNVEAFLDSLISWKTGETTHAFVQWLSDIMQSSGFIDWVQKHQESRVYLEDVTAIFTQAKQWNQQDHTFNLARFLERIDTITEHGLSIPREQTLLNANSVTVCTVHKAKGREWEYVYIPQLVDGNWGNARQPAGIPLPEGILRVAPEKTDKNEDDRRLLYVAITRAKLSVHLSYSQTVASSGKMKDTSPSQFVTEIPAELLKEEVVTPTAGDIQTAESLLLAPPTFHTWREDQRAWLQEIVNNLELSVSVLNTYLRSPLEFYQTHLLRIPRSKPTPLAFGTAIHSALESHYRYVQTHDGIHPPLEQTLERFSQILNRELLSQEDLTVRLRQGTQALQSYISYHKDQPTQVVTTEEGFGWKRGKVMLDDISLTGKIDRIDWIDQQEKIVRLVDYKTGKAKTVGDIEGKTLAAGLSERELTLPDPVRGPLKRQLLFYKLLMSLDRQYKTLTIGDAVFDFVEPVKGEFIQRPFTLHDSDVEDLKALIADVMKEIRELRFLEEI